VVFAGVLGGVEADLGDLALAGRADGQRHGQGGLGTAGQAAFSKDMIASLTVLRARPDQPPLADQRSFAHPSICFTWGYGDGMAATNYADSHSPGQARECDQASTAWSRPAATLPLRVGGPR
jgi:hypothetical protein